MKDMSDKNVISDLMQASILCQGKGNSAVLNVFPQQNLPYLKEEIFRTIEKSFDTIGAATGKGIKTDKYNEETFNQFLVALLSPDNFGRLISGYRYALWDVMHGLPDTPFNCFFDVKDTDLLSPEKRVLELGTAWSNPTNNDREKLFGLSSTWDGLAALMERYKNDFFVGKLTIPKDYPPAARDLAINYLAHQSDVPYACSVDPKTEYAYTPQYNNDFISVISAFGNSPQDIKAINRLLSDTKYGGVGVLPAMFPIYISRFIPRKFHYVGTVRNGPVLESGIVVPVDAIDPSVHEKYKESLSKGPRIHENMTLGEYLQVSKSQ